MGKRSFVFLIINLTHYLGRVVICVNIACFPNHRQKRKLEKSENLQKDTFQKINFFSITQQLFAKLLSLSSNTVCHHRNRI